MGITSSRNTGHCRRTAYITVAVYSAVDAVTEATAL
jgi:hypothetical protein